VDCDGVVLIPTGVGPDIRMAVSTCLSLLKLDALATEVARCRNENGVSQIDAAVNRRSAGARRE
jgi:hypothetical protein